MMKIFNDIRYSMWRSQLKKTLEDSVMFLVLEYKIKEYDQIYKNEGYEKVLETHNKWINEMIQAAEKIRNEKNS